MNCNQSIPMAAKSFCSRECAFEFRKDDNHHAWKGKKASYSAIHKYVTSKFGKPKLCVNCHTTGTRSRMEWANISRKYLRDRSDWIELCASCHRHFDKSTGKERSVIIARWEKYTGKKAELVNDH